MGGKKDLIFHLRKDGHNPEAADVKSASGVPHSGEMRPKGHKVERELKDLQWISRRQILKP